MQFNLGNIVVSRVGILQLNGLCVFLRGCKMRGYVVWIMCELINMEHLLNDNDNMKTKYVKEDVSACLFVHHKSHVD